ncbi:MAG: TonB-dependent receptor [Bacteroidales bacterium]|nr:TonB-dependent receptor [Bacteroidales bacterium]
MRKLTILFLSLMLGFTSMLYGQEKVITGKVISGEDESPLPGASVAVKGTTTGTVTDINGNFSLSVPENSILVVSYVGYLSEELPTEGQDVINVTLLPDISKLEEIVIVGYGVQKKSLVTGSIAKVEARDMENAVSTRFEQALQGKVSGMVVAQNSGAPGSGLTIKIRGNSSDGSNSPLILVDGVRTGGMEYLNPSDIASIEVLKDAASSAIYGADGGNGVLLITTKKGTKNASALQYNYTKSIQMPTNLMEVMDGNQYREYFMEAATWENKPAKYAQFSALDSTISTNWVEEVFQNATMDEHNLSFSGGTENISYFLSGSYLSQDGIVGGPKNNFTRYSFRSNIEAELKSWLSAGTNISYTRASKKNLNATNEYGGIINNSYTYDPTIPVYYPDTSWILQTYRDNPEIMAAWNRTEDGHYYSKSAITTGEAWNPVAQIDAAQDRQAQDKIVADIHFDLKPVKWLKFTSRVFIDYAYQKHDIFTGKNFYGVDPITADSNTFVEQSWDRWFKYGIENYLTFNKMFGNHSVEVMLGQSYEDYKHDYLYTKYFHIQYNSLDYAFPNASLDRERFDVQDQTLDPDMSRLASYFGRFVYNYKEKYMLQGNFRYDGASNFGPDNPWVLFPSFSAGWTISREEFFRNVSQLSFIDLIKLRASWGQNGSRQVLGSFPYVTTMTTVYYSDASPTGSRDIGKVPGRPANRAIAWETSQQTDIGIDLRFFRNTLSFSVDWYKKSTIGQLAEKADLPTYLGFQDRPIINSGEVVNRGWEFDLSYRNSAGDLKYFASFNASYLYNEVVDYGVEQGRDGANVGQLGVINRYDIGQPVWYFYGYEAIGIFQDTAEINHYGYVNPANGRFVKLQSTAKPGDVKFKDQPVDTLGGETDHRLDASDRVYLGKPLPDWTFGLTLGIEYKGFDLSIFFQGVTGNQVYWAGYRNDRTEYNRAVMWYENRWTGPGTSDKYPRATNTDANNNFRVSSMNVYDGDYLRLKNLTVGYTLPQKITKYAHISKFRIYYTGTNLLTWTKYPGTDPEVGMYDSGNNTTLGIDKGLYPPTMIHSFGVNIVF